MRHIPFIGALIVFLLAAIVPKTSHAQCTLQCLGGTVDIPLDNSCSATVDPAALIVNDPDCDPLDLELADEFGLPFPGNTLGFDQLYKLYTARITFNGPPSQTCTVQIRAVDNIAPTIVTTCVDVTIDCNADTSTANVQQPAFSDNCGPLLVTRTDLQLNGSCPFVPYRIRRTFTATDQGGNTATCSQTISLSYQNIGDIVPPFQVFNMDCLGSPYDLSITDQPFLNGRPLKTGDYCGFTVGYTDTNDPNPPSNPLTIGRLWTVEDCLGNTATYQQTITVTDNEPPQITCPANLTISASPSNCNVETTLPPATVVDTCSGLAFITATDNGIPFTYGMPHTFSVGTHLITYTATDVVGNTASCNFQLTVVDNSPPMISCKDIGVNLLPSGSVDIQADTLLFTKNDNCGINSILARRMDILPLPPFGPMVSFTCDDIMNNPISVTVQVIDLGGNAVTCIAKVTVQDKVSPTILECPKDTFIDCNVLNPNLAVYGTATFIDACGVSNSYTEDDQRNKCGSGLILRKWVGSDPSGNTAVCEQIIDVINGNPLSDDLINWPDDTTFFGCTPIEFLQVDELEQPYKEPVVDLSVCSIIAIGHKDEVLVVANPGCYKILRTWTVVDCCIYDPNNPSAGGIYTHVQLLKVMDNEKPVINCPPTLEVAADGDCGTSYVTVPILEVTDCNPNVKITNNSPFSDKKGADASGTYPYGKTKVTFTVNDMCGNYSHCTLEINVTDLSPPTPICKWGLSVDLGLCEGEIVAKINASFFNNKSYDNCSLNGALTFSFSSDVTDVDTMFTCDNLDTNYVQIWVTDELGNQDYCKTYILVQDNMDLCPSGKPTKIMGTITAESGDPVSGAQILLTGPVNKQMVTGVDGKYSFQDLPPGGDYQLTGSKSTDPLKGVSTYDLLLIQKHLLGVKQLNNPMMQLAADANLSGVISISDVIQLRKWILSPKLDVAPNKAWRFLNPAVPMNPSNPLLTPGLEMIPLQDITGEVSGIDLTAIKIGDINGDAFDDGLWNDLVRDDESPLILSALDQTFEAGDAVEVILHTRDFQNIQAWQMALGWDPTILTFGGMQTLADELKMDNGNIGLDEVEQGILRLSWSDTYGVDLQDGSGLLHLHFTASQSGRLSESLHLNANAMRPEVITQMIATSGEADLAKGIALQWSDQEPAEDDKVVLYQNKPNPFRDMTMIGFRLPEAADVILTLLDVSGQVITQFRGKYPPGYHEISVPGEILPPNGLIYYRIEGPNFNETRKMIRQ